MLARDTPARSSTCLGAAHCTGHSRLGLPIALLYGPRPPSPGFCAPSRDCTSRRRATPRPHEPELRDLHPWSESIRSTLSTDFAIDEVGHTIRFVRDIDAPPARVFAAWTEPE